jgi:hypothetical protein
MGIGTDSVMPRKANSKCDAGAEQQATRTLRPSPDTLPIPSTIRAVRQKMASMREESSQHTFPDILCAISLLLISCHAVFIVEDG